MRNNKTLESKEKYRQNTTKENQPKLVTKPNDYQTNKNLVEKENTTMAGRLNNDVLSLPNKTSLRDYQLQVLIGQGAFSVVRRATVKDTGHQVAIKQYDKGKLIKQPEFVECLKNEIKAMSKLNHDGIMKYYDAIDQSNKISIIVEYINGNNLY